MASENREVVFKSVNEAKRLVYGEVYAPDRPDADNEFMRADQIEKMAYDFMRSMKLDAVDRQHDNVSVPGCCVVESFIARKGDPDFIEGAWVVGMHIDNDEAWEQVVKGEINGFSIEAFVRKNPQEVTMEIPDVLSGLTMKSGDGEDAHEHEFFVTYSPEGKFIGGKTSIAKGHYHLIKRGTITEDAEGHNHRFAHVDGITIR